MQDTTRQDPEKSIRSIGISPLTSLMSCSRKKARLGIVVLLLPLLCSMFHVRCDERFVGYGGNKAACLFEMYLSGISYYVLADHFIIHQNHVYEETARRNEVCFHFC